MFYSIYFPSKLPSTIINGRIGQDFFAPIFDLSNHIIVMTFSILSLLLPTLTLFTEKPHNPVILDVFIDLRINMYY